MWGERVENGDKIRRLYEFGKPGLEQVLHEVFLTNRGQHERQRRGSQKVAGKEKY